MRQTVASIENNKWLAGAKVIYDVVRSKREGQSKDTLPFADWAGINFDVDNLTVGQSRAHSYSTSWGFYGTYIAP